MPASQAADPHAGHDMSAMGGTLQQHPASEQGNPLVDMQTMTPTAKLDDPGIGLRGNGRRVLTYADLFSVFPDPDGREPGRTIELHLTGHMERYAWSFNGIKFSSAEPLRLTYGERVRVVLVNDTMMTHPIHLHGMWSDLEDEQGRFQVRKHTIDMPPGSRRTLQTLSVAPWIFSQLLALHTRPFPLADAAAPRVSARPNLERKNGAVGKAGPRASRYTLSTATTSSLRGMTRSCPPLPRTWMVFSVRSTCPCLSPAHSLARMPVA